VAVAAALLAAMCLRVVVALVREQLHSDPVRTAIAKGVPHKQVVRRHAGPYARATTAWLVGLGAPITVTNLILVEHHLLRSRVLPEDMEGERPYRQPALALHRLPDARRGLDLGVAVRRGAQLHDGSLRCCGSIRASARRNSSKRS
jgi:hypothetical protein